MPLKAAEPLTVPKMFKAAARPPVPAGVKVSVTVHEPLTAIVPPFAQVPAVRTNSAAFGPVKVKNGVAKTSDAFPVFETVIVSGALVVFTSWFPNAPSPGEKLRTGTAGATPVPVKATLSGLEAALVTNTKLADLLPTVVGVKTTFNVQERLGARLAPQVLPLVENCEASAPVKLILAIVSVEVPELVSVTALFPLDVLVV